MNPTIQAKIDSLHCKGLCWDSCGPIPVTDEENRRVKLYAARNNLQVFSLQKHYQKWRPRAMENYRRGVVGLPEASGCPYIKDKRCSVYEVRPTICRMYGVTDSKHMVCPYGCIPELGYLNPDEAAELMKDVGLL